MKKLLIVTLLFVGFGCAHSHKHDHGHSDKSDSERFATVIKWLKEYNKDHKKLLAKAEKNKKMVAKKREKIKTEKDPLKVKKMQLEVNRMEMEMAEKLEHHNGDHAMVMEAIYGVEHVMEEMEEHDHHDH